MPVQNCMTKKYSSLCVSVNDCNSVQYGTEKLCVAQQHGKTPKSIVWMILLLDHRLSGPLALAV